MDDEALPKGLYFLRARVTDAAGLEASNDRAVRRAARAGQAPDPARQPPQRRPPRRTARCSGHGRKRRCRYRLATQADVSASAARRASTGA